MRKVRMRKMIALLLAAVMAFSLVIVTGAAEVTDTPETSQQTVKLIVKKTAATTTSATYKIYLDASACDGVAALQFKLVPAVGMTQGTVTLGNFDTQFNVPEAGSSAYTENGGQYGYTDNTGMYVAFGGDVSKDQCIKGNVLVMTIPYTFDETVTPSLTVAADSFKACKSGSDALTNPYNCVVEYEDATATPTTYSIEAVGKDENTPQYTLSGTDLTVTYSAACAVGYSTDNGQTYTHIKASSGNGNSYVYDLSAVPANAQIIVVVKGDVSGDGKVKSNDVSTVKAVNLGKATVGGKAFLAADVSGDGKIKSNDVSTVKAVNLGKTTLAWDTQK